MSVFHPVVEVLYSYESTNDRGHSVIVQPREKYVLLCDQDDEWWYVNKDIDSEDGFYIPRTYVKVLQMQASRIPPSANVNNNSSNVLLNFNTNSLETFRRPSANRQSAIVTGSNGTNSVNLGGNSGNLYSLATTSTTESPDANNSLRRRTGPGFKLAAPDRISRSIPVGLNFVHDIPTFNHNPQLITNGFNNFNTLERFNNAMDSSVISENSVDNGSNNEIENVTIAVKKKDEDNNVATNINGNMPHAKINDGPIYANLPPKSSSEIPPVPSDMSNFVRTLQDGWKAYEDQFGRPYFYNTKSGVSTWKPPRVVSVCLKHDNGTVLNSSEELDSSFSADDNDRYRDLPTTPTVSQMRSLFSRSYSNECRDQSIPEYREEMSANDSILLETNENAESSKIANDNSAKPLLSFVNRSFGIPPRLPKKDMTKCSEDLAGLAGSASQSPDAMSAEAASFFQKGASFRRNSQQTWIKSGFVSKCKYAENGKRIKKQWICCFAYLTSAHIIFYKDEKSAEKKNNQYDPPLGVCDLRGAKLKWLEGDKTKRRHVFQLDLVDGSTYLFHMEENQEAVSWYQAVQQVIGHLPQPDFYPPPTFNETSPKSTHSRKFSASGYSFSHRQYGHDLERKPTNNYSKDKKSSITGSITSTADSHELQQSRESILDKLRRFFSIRPSIESLKERGIYKPEPVFGSSLIEICARERSTVPKFIRICTKLIEDKGLDNDGLYRMSGNLSQVQKIRCQVDQDKYNLLQNETDIHVLTGALKLFFRELPNPLFPYELTKDFLSAIRIQDHKARLKKFRELICRMPDQHRDCLDVLLRHLLRVADYASKNRMQIHNLAIVFGPTLFSTESNRTSNDGRKKKGLVSKSASTTLNSKNSAETIQSNSHLAFTMIMQGQIVEYMLKTHDRLFQHFERQQQQQAPIGIGH